MDEYRPPSSLWNIRWPLHNIISGSRPEQNIEYFNRLNLDFVVDSQIIYGDKDQVEEVQLVMFPQNGKKNQIAWFRIFNKNSFPIKQPALSRLPIINSFSGYSKFHLTVLRSPNNLISSNIYIASINNDYGPHDALWWGDKNAFLLQISASSGNTIEYFKKFFLTCVKRLKKRFND